jgi:hypothetical protein
MTQSLDVSVSNHASAGGKKRSRDALCRSWGLRIHSRTARPAYSKFCLNCKQCVFTVFRRLCVNVNTTDATTRVCVYTRLRAADEARCWRRKDTGVQGTAQG